MVGDGIRQTQYAGSWYEANPEKLASQLEQFLQNAKVDLNNEKQKTHFGQSHQERMPLAVVSPHAGFMFSGATAGYSFEFAKSAQPKRIFILGPSHHVAFRGAALPKATSFETPLGNLEVDTRTIEGLSACSMFSVQPDIHRVEHSLEMQLPFIKQAFTDVKIIPIVIGHLQNEAEIRTIADSLKGFVRADDLIVVSSDFTHYGPRYDFTPFKTDVRNNISKLDKEAFEHLAAANVADWLQFEARTHDTICGFYPCAVLCAMLPPDAQAKLLKYSTSQDVLPDEQNNSVSYMAIEFSGTGWSQSAERKTSAEEDVVHFSELERQTLIKIARASLESWIIEHKRFDAQTANLEITSAHKNSYGVFVTLFRKPPPNIPADALRGGKELRGCIGSIWPTKPLWETVAETVVSSATKDPRFHPVEASELEDLVMEISVLTPPRRVESYRDIVIGRDGIILSMNNRQSVFLPSVATELGWSLEQTLTELALKAGLEADDWKSPNAKFECFQSVSIEENGH